MAEPAWLDAPGPAPGPIPRDPPPPPGYVDPLDASSVLDHLAEDVRSARPRPDGQDEPGGRSEAGGRRGADGRTEEQPPTAS